MIMRYLEYINENKDVETVYLDDDKGGPGFVTNKYGHDSIAELGKKIYNYIKGVYGPFGFTYPMSGAFDAAEYEHRDLNIGGRLINTEYIAKMVNNYLVFKNFIRENAIRDASTFYALLESNFADVYHYEGDFFKRQSLPILINATRKGNYNEIRAKAKFVEYAESQGLDITVTDPTLDEDLRGIDAKFRHKGKELTIQIKPFTQYKIEADKLYAKSPGSLSINSVNYLMLYSGREYLIIKNLVKSKIEIVGDNFIAPFSNVIYSPLV